MKVEKDNCSRLQCEANANDHWANVLCYFHFYLVKKCGQAIVANLAINFRKGVDPEWGSYSVAATLHSPSEIQSTPLSTTSWGGECTKSNPPLAS